MVIFGKRVQSVRKNQGLTQAELAMRVGMPPAHLCRIEIGRTDPSLGTATRIAEALGVELSDLLSEVEVEKKTMTVSEPLTMSERLNDPPSAVREAVEKDVERIWKRIEAREKEIDRLERRLGIASTTTLQLIHPFIRDEGGAETLARVVRESIGAGSVTFADLSGLLELHGVRIHFLELPQKEIQSLAYFRNARHVLSIVVDAKMTPERQTYRIAFELAYACLYAYGGYATVKDAQHYHHFARRFTAAFLMPEDAVRTTFAQMGLSRRDWTMEMLLKLKIRFNVSAETFALRLEELGLIMPALRVKFREALHAYYAAHPRVMEPAPRLPPLRRDVRLDFLRVAAK